MRYIVTLLFIVAIFFACNTASNNFNGSYKPGNLETLQYEINTGRDTTIHTKNGAILKIPKGALTSKDGSAVTLEVKEAYTIEQMIMAGLTTASNGRPLSSGGMIYIGAKDGQDVTFNEKIQVSIPTEYIDKDMKVWNGKEENGSINWDDPVALPEQPSQEPIDSGQLLFMSKCASCHILGKQTTGPDLAHFMKRFRPEVRYEKYYYSHLIKTKDERLPRGDDGRMSLRGDTITLDERYIHHDLTYELYRCNLQAMFPVKAPEFPELRDDSIALKIFRYIQNESDRRNLPIPSHHPLLAAADSCVNYYTMQANLQMQQEALKAGRKYFIADNGFLVNVVPDTTWIQAFDPIPVDTAKVEVKLYESVYYQFDIESFGWRNIDVLLAEKENVAESELFAKVTGTIKEKMNMFLIIPSAKVYGQGGPANRNREEFAFFHKDGKIPLPQGVKAYVVAMTEVEADGTVAFGVTAFTTTTSQELSVELHKATKEEFTKAMQSFDQERLHIKVKDSKNADKIRKIDEQLKKIESQLKDVENLKPKGCDCDCLKDYAETASVIETSSK